MSDASRAAVRSIWAATAVSALIVAWAHAPAFASRWWVNDDVRQQLFWMERWSDPQLYPADLLVDYAQRYVPWGVQGLYRAAALIVEPLFFSKLLGAALFAALSALVFSIGLALGGRRLAWTTVMVCWLMPFFLDSLAGGLSRAFVAPLLALHLLARLIQRPRLEAAALVAAALLAPYAFVLCATTSLLAWAGTARHGLCLRQVRAPAMALVLGVGLVVAFNASFGSAGYGPLVDSTALSRPEFGPEGRYPYLPPLSPLFELLIAPCLSLAPFREAGFVAGVATLAALGLLLLRASLFRPPSPGHRLLRACGPLLAASLMLYVLARLVALRLFFPARYLEYTAPLCLCLLAAVALEQALGRLCDRRRLGALVVIACAALAAARLRGVGLSDYSADQALVTRVRELPKETRLAGHPYRLDNVLAFGQRRVIATYELAQPWARGLWGRLEPRLDELFAAYYAADPAEVEAFSVRQGVDFWVVDERDFRPDFLNEPSALVPVCEALHLPSSLERLCQRLPLEWRIEDARRRHAGVPGRAPFFAPFDARIRRLTSGRSRFALLDESLFPGERLGPTVRLVDVRQRGAAKMTLPWSTAGSR